MPGYNPIPAGQVNSGNYTGNNTVNRAIPHGLTTQPKQIIIINSSDGTHIILNVNAQAEFQFAIAGTFNEIAVTAPDTTNFYVGNAGSYPNSANATGKVYQWIAVG